MPSLSDLYNNLPGLKAEPVSDLYKVTNTPWVANNTPNDPIDFQRQDYSQHVMITMGSPTTPIRFIWPIKVFCLSSLFFRSIFMPPSTPITPDPTPAYILRLRQEFKSKSCIPFPCTTKPQIDAFAIFMSWNMYRSLQKARVFAGITSDDVYERLEQYVILWDQMLECYKLSQFLIAPEFANEIIDTMVLALKEETSYQTKRRKIKDEKRESMRAELESALTDPDTPSAYQVLLGVAFPGHPSNQTTPSQSGQKLPELPPDCRNVLGATPKQITKLYGDTNPGSPLRRMIVDMIISYSIRYPKYYGQNGGFGKLLGGSEPGTEGEFWVPMEFVRDLLAAYAKVASKTAGAVFLARVDRCKYHDHKNGGDCPVKNKHIPGLGVTTLRNELAPLDLNQTSNAIVMAEVAANAAESVNTIAAANATAAAAHGNI
ncbi:hypothetical protein NHQ30_002585 [Ciborinia camelliae]|nr:hypothetical protein NHQ30_002585 [Ciborinia camelliae]